MGESVSRGWPLADVVVLAELGAEDRAAKLVELGETPQAEALFGLGKPKPWEHASHAIGLIVPPAPGAAKVPLVAASQVPPALSLQGRAVDVRLDRLCVADYPGKGPHHVLVTMHAAHRPDGRVEEVAFSQAYRVNDGDFAGVAGHPVFRGLAVDGAGLTLRVLTVNVKNETDETLLAALDKGPFVEGLSLLALAQPAIVPFTELTLAVVRSLLKRNRNVPVQRFELGLDFEPSAMGARLAVGTYVVAQVPAPGALTWSDWVFDVPRGTIAHATTGEPLPFNHLCFRLGPAA